MSRDVGARSRDVGAGLAQRDVECDSTVQLLTSIGRNGRGPKIGGLCPFGESWVPI